MSTQWHLKKYDDGSVFGPVDVPTLHEWVAKGEISPYDMLSPDGVKWIAAPEMEDLQMNWIVEFPDGEAYGPTCIEAIRAFIEDGQLTTENTIRDANLGEKCLIGEHPAFQDMVATEQGTDDAAAPAEEEAADPGEPADDVEAFQARVAELEETNAKMQAAHEVALAQLNQELVTAKTQQQFLRSELDLMKETSQTEHSAREVSRSDMEIELDRIREQFNILFEINKQLTQNYEESVAQLNRKIQDTLSKIDQFAEREAELNREVAEAAQREADYREQIISMEKELVKSEQAHANLLGKYAELNDRLMEFLKRSAGEPAATKSGHKK